MVFKAGYNAKFMPFSNIEDDKPLNCIKEYNLYTIGMTLHFKRQKQLNKICIDKKSITRF